MAQKVENTDQLNEFLQKKLSVASKKLFSEGQGFSRVEDYYAQIGNLQEKFKSVHVAGTSGKGSTVYYTSAILKAHGFKVGSLLSPRVFDLRENSMIDLEFLDQTYYIKQFLEFIKDAVVMPENKKPTYFEALVGNAFSIFAQNKVDYAVIETGLGGKFDSTNTIKRSDKLAVITKIGLDHTEILGQTLPEIAEQKAGIIPKDGSSLVLSQPNNIVNVFKKVAKEKNSQLEIAKGAGSAQNIKIDRQGIVFDYNDEDLVIKDCHLPTFAHYQVENACLAIATVKHLAGRDGFDINHDHVRRGLSQTVVPGRCEVRVVGGKTVILDGAHNPQKFASLVDSIQRLGLSKPPIWLLAFKKDKDVKQMVNIADSYSDIIIFSEFFKNSQNTNLHSLSCTTKELKALSIRPSSLAINDQARAFKIALLEADQDQIIIISGSLYFIGELLTKSLNIFDTNE